MQLLAETEKALLVTDGTTKKFKNPVDGTETDEQQKCWLPKSQVEFIHKDGGLIEVTLPEWLAKEKGLI